MQAHRVVAPVRERRGYLRLDLGEADCPVSAGVADALAALPPEALSRYPDPWPLQRALGARHGVPPEHIALTAGTDEGIRLVYAAFVEEGSRVVLPRPTFGAFVAAADAAGAFVERVSYDDELQLPIEDLVKATARHAPRLVGLSHPDAPTGTALDIDAVRALATERPATLFLINESFVAWHGPSFLDAPLPPNVAVLRSFSKDHGLAGLRIGYLVAHPAIVDATQVVQPSYTLSAPSIAAALAALADDGAVVPHIVRVRRAMERLEGELSARGISSRQTRASFMLVRLSAPIGRWAAGFAARGVLVGTSGHAGPLADCVRLTVNDDQQAERFLEALDLLLAHGVDQAAAVRHADDGFRGTDGEGMA